MDLVRTTIPKGTLKQGTKVKVSFTGTVVAHPRKPTETMPDPGIRVRVDGLPGWWSIVPMSQVEIVEDEG